MKRTLIAILTGAVLGLSFTPACALPVDRALKGYIECLEMAREEIDEDEPYADEQPTPETCVRDYKWAVDDRRER